MILSCQKIKHSSAFHKSVEHTGKMWTVSITSKKKKKEAIIQKTEILPSLWELAQGAL